MNEKVEGTGVNMLQIIACSDSDYTRTEEVYTALINPEEFKESFVVSYDDTQGMGQSEAHLRFDRKEPAIYTLNLLFDSTGVIRRRSLPGTNAGSTFVKEPVEDQIKSFKEVCLEFNGQTHEPRYVIIVFGSLEYKGRLMDLNITYTLFNNEGKPLRARATATFSASMSTYLAEAKNKTSSPDMTHIRTVMAGDTLPEMTRKVYGSDRYYLEVARINRLKNFRDLTPGTVIQFPPLDNN